MSSCELVRMSVVEAGGRISPFFGLVLPSNTAIPTPIGASAQHAIRANVGSTVAAPFQNQSRNLIGQRAVGYRPNSSSNRLRLNPTITSSSTTMTGVVIIPICINSAMAVGSLIMSLSWNGTSFSERNSFASWQKCQPSGWV